MSAKLMQDEKVAKLVERQVKQAVNAEKKRILAGLKDLKEEMKVDNITMTRHGNKVIVEANKIVRNTQPKAA